jgi:hypothetical protein
MIKLHGVAQAGQNGSPHTEPQGTILVRPDCIAALLTHGAHTQVVTTGGAVFLAWESIEEVIGAVQKAVTGKHLVIPSAFG